MVQDVLPARNNRRCATRGWENPCVAAIARGALTVRYRDVTGLLPIATIDCCGSWMY